MRVRVRLSSARRDWADEASAPARPPARQKGSDMRFHPSTPNPPPSSPEDFEPPSLPSEPVLSCILVVEDKAIIRRFIKAAVAPLAHEVIATGSARRAVAIANARSPDLILVDLRLRDVHGTSLIARVRHLGVRSSIIVVTGYPDDLPDEVRALGVAAVLHKPVTARSLLKNA